MLLAQQCIGNLAEPILLEIQQRKQEILEYLSGDLEQSASQRFSMIRQ